MNRDPGRINPDETVPQKRAGSSKRPSPFLHNLYTGQIPQDVPADSEPRVSIRDEWEIVIRVGIRRRSKGRQWITAELELIDALQLMRRKGYEVDLYIRGTWRRQNGGRMSVIPETLWPNWRTQDGAIQGTPVLPCGDWLPAVGRRPGPEIVLRGVRQ